MLPTFVVYTETDAEQVPDDRMQVIGENTTLPFPEPLDQVTVPVCDGKLPDTVAVQVIDEKPVVTDDGVHATTVAVGAILMVSAVGLELP